MTAVPSSDELLAIEIAVALPARQRLVRLQVVTGTNVGQALDLAAASLGGDAAQPDQPVGVWGVRVGRERILVAGDRIELYRPLPADPKDTRRRLARQGRSMGSRPAR